MKPLIKYMGLLLFSGPIISICNLSPAKTCVTPLNPKAGIIRPANKPLAINPFFYEDVIKNIFPVLKNLN